MKRIISFILVCLLMLSTFACGLGKKESHGKSISAIFTGVDKQPFSGKKGFIDTIWVYYDDGTFEQYAEIENELVPFSTGVYHFENDGNFIDGQKDSSKGQIVINRNKKYQEGKGFADYSSLHTYDLYSLEYEPIYLYEEGKPKMTALFAGDDKQYFINNKRRQYLDTFWMFFDDNRFKQYTEINRAIEEFSEGTYSLSKNANFVNLLKEKKDGNITIIREKLYKYQKGLINVSSSQTFDLNELGFKCIWVLV